MITQEELKHQLDYCDKTGIFTHKFTKSRQSKKGDIAGCLNNKGYRAITISGKKYKAHRLAWLYIKGTIDIDQIDHINGNRDDNRISNLRVVSGNVNNKNAKIPKNNTSGVIGVRWCKTYKKWTSHIAHNNKKITIGRFDNKTDAIRARKEAERKYGFHENHGRSA